MIKPADWTEAATSGAASAQTISHAAEANTQHFVTQIAVGLSATGTAVVTIEDDDVVIWSGVCYDSMVVNFQNPLAIERGNKVDLEIASAGGAITSRGTLVGYSK